MPKTKRTQRLRPQQNRVIELLRTEIVTGALAPGMRVPPRRELAEQFSVSLLTVQQAVDRLAREGFVEARGRLGTFVAERPPHLMNYAIVFDHLPNERSFPRFFTAVAREAHGFDDEDRKITPWYGVQPRMDCDAFRRLCGLVRDHRVAGLIFPAPPHAYVNTPLLDEPGIPRVAMRSSDGSRFEGVAELQFSALLDRAFEYFAARGRRNVAVLHQAGVTLKDPSILDRLGLRMQPCMWQVVSYSEPEGARNLAHLMVRRQQQDPPDALFVGDDNLLEYATAGIIDAGVRVPEELEVVGHCNFPWPTPSALPVRRLGYDVREFLRCCLQSLDEQRQGREPAMRVIDAKFEDEVPDPAY